MMPSLILIVVASNPIPYTWDPDTTFNQQHRRCSQHWEEVLIDNPQTSRHEDNRPAATPKTVVREPTLYTVARPLDVPASRCERRQGTPPWVGTPALWGVC